MGASVILAAVGGGQMEEAWRIVQRQSLVIFGTLDELALTRLVNGNGNNRSEVSVYFYQSG